MLLSMVFVVSCASGDNKQDKAKVEHKTEKSMKIKVTSGNASVVFELNNTTAAKSLYDQLPIEVNVDNYSNNEKVFDPKIPLKRGSNNIEGNCPVGTIAWFSPWGNIAMYYGKAPSWNGLYLMGKAVEGVDKIKELKGKTLIEKL